MKPNKEVQSIFHWILIICNRIHATAREKKSKVGSRAGAIQFIALVVGALNSMWSIHFIPYVNYASMVTGS